MEDTTTHTENARLEPRCASREADRWLSIAETTKPMACCILQKALSSRKDSPWHDVLPDKNPKGMPLGIGWIDVPLTLRRIRKEFELDLADRKESNRITRLVERGQLIVLDDVGAERATDFQVDEVQMWLRERYNNQVPTIVTSNHTVETIRKIDARTASRISSGRIIQMKGKDYRAVRT